MSIGMAKLAALLAQKLSTEFTKSRLPSSMSALSAVPATWPSKGYFPNVVFTPLLV